MALALLVESERRRGCKLMVAEEHVASLIGMSPSWLRKYLRNSREVSDPRIPLLLRIRTAYDDLCERIERENDAREARHRTLKVQLDAIAQSIDPKARSYLAGKKLK